MKAKVLIAMILLAVCAGVAQAQYYSDRKHDEGTDTLMVYNSWHSVYYKGRDTVAINPNVEIYSPFQYKFKPTEKDHKPLSKMIEKQSVAVAIGDSVWLVNSKYLKDSLQGGYNKYFHDYLPLYFSEKIAFFQYLVAQTLNILLVNLCFYAFHQSISGLFPIFPKFNIISHYGFYFLVCHKHPLL